METFKLILSLIPPLVGALAALFGLLKAAKAKREAKNSANETAIANAELQMEQAAKRFISEAENTYSAFDNLLKQQGKSAGALKKETVIAKLRTYAIENGITINVEAWSNKIDELVKFTKEVNVKKS